MLKKIMRMKLQKAVALLILSAFLAVSAAANVFGCTDCVSGERAQRVNTFTENGCCTTDLIKNHNDGHYVTFIHQLTDDQRGSCPNCSTQQGSTAFSKRTKRIPTTAPTSIISNNFQQTASINFKLVVGNLTPQPPTRTSQTLLSHRTIVLLN